MSGLDFHPYEIRTCSDREANALLEVQTWVSGPGGMEMLPAWRYISSVRTDSGLGALHVMARSREIVEEPEWHKEAVDPE